MRYVLFSIAIYFTALASISVGQQFTAPARDAFKPEIAKPPVDSNSTSGSEPEGSLRSQYLSAEEKSRELARSLRSVMNKAKSPAGLRQVQIMMGELRKAVSDAFHARQELQQAEMAAFALRLERLRQLTEARQSNAELIIGHRVDELLKPNLAWNVDPVDVVDQVASVEVPDEPEADPASRVKIRLSSDTGFRVRWQQPSLGEVSRSPQESEFYLKRGEEFRFQLENIDSQIGLKVAATIEPLEAHSNAEVATTPAKLLVPVHLSEVDLNHLAAGHDITKAVHLDSHGSCVTVNSYQLDADSDAIEVAKERGELVAVIQLFGRPSVVTPIRDVGEIEGKWRFATVGLVPGEFDSSLPAKDLLKQHLSGHWDSIQIQGDQWLIELPDGNSTALRATYDLAASPQSVTLGGDEIRKGVFERDGNLLRVGYFADPAHADEAPKSMSDPGLLVLTYGRASEDLVGRAIMGRIFRAWEERQKRATAVKFEVLIKRSTPRSELPWATGSTNGYEDGPQPSELIDTVSTAKLWLDFENHRARLETEGDTIFADFETGTSRVVPSLRVRLFDGTNQQEFRPAAGNWFRKGSPELDRLENRSNAKWARWFAVGDLNPLFYALGMLPDDKREITAEMPLQFPVDRGFHHYERTSMVEGRELVVVRTGTDHFGHYLKHWVDVDHDAAIVESEFYREDKLRHEKVVKHYQTKNGWLPKEWTTRILWTDLPKSTYQLINYEFDPDLSEVEFHITPEAGVIVWDEKTDQTVISGGPGNPDLPYK